MLLENSECAEWKRRDVSATGKRWWEEAMNDVMEEKETARSVLDKYRVRSGLPAVGFGLWGWAKPEGELAEGEQLEVGEGGQEGGQEGWKEARQQANQPRVFTKNASYPQGLISGALQLEHQESHGPLEKAGNLGNNTALSVPKVDSQVVVNYSPTTIDFSQAAAGIRRPGAAKRQAAAGTRLPLEQHRGEEAYACYSDPPTQPIYSQKLDEATTLRTQLTGLLLPPSSQGTEHLTLDIDNFGHHTIVHITPHTTLSDILEAAFHSTPPRVRNLQRSAVLRGNGPIRLAKGVCLVIDGWMDPWTESVWERIFAVALTMAVPQIWECEVATEGTKSDALLC